MIDWNDLRFLVAVADRGSASAAARGLGVDKATVSRRVGALERSLGVRLFDRRASGWTATAAGQKVVETGRRVDGSITALLGNLGAVSPSVRVPVRITAPLWFCESLLLPRIGAFQDAARFVDLNLSARSRVVDLAEREAEIGLRNIRPQRGEFVVRRAGELGSAIYAARSYLARRPPVVDRDGVVAESLVGYPDRLSYVPGFAWLEEQYGDRAPPLRVDDASAIVAALKAEAGLAVIPCFLGDREPGLVRVMGERHSETIWLVAPSDVARTLAVRKVMGFVAGCFAANADALRGT